MENRFKVGISAAASWAWGTSLIVGMQIAQQKGLIAWSIWAIANFLTLALFGFLTDIGLLGRQVFNKKPIKISALIIQIFCLVIQLNIIYQVLLDLGLTKNISYLISSFIGIFFTIIMYKKGLNMSIRTDVWQWILCLISIFSIISIGYFTSVPKLNYPESNMNDILWGIWSAIILFSGPIGDVQHWQRAEVSRNTGAYYIGSISFSIYMILILIMSQFKFNDIMNWILLFAVLCVTTSTIDSIAVVLHEISNKTIGTIIGILICIFWGIFVEFGILTLWSYAGIFRVGFALVILYFAFSCFLKNKTWRFKMNKIISFIFAFVASLILSTSAIAAVDTTSYNLGFSKEDLRGMYIAPKVGIGYVEIDDLHLNGSDRYSHKHSTAFATGLAIGYDFSKKYTTPVRMELDYTYLNRTKFYVNDDTHHVSTHTLLVNVAYDFKEVPVVTPYIVGGIGTAWNSSSNTQFAYNIGAGVYYNVTDNVAIDFSVKYVDNGSVNKYGYKADFNGANTILALRYTF